ncbi:unnamed protein product, partial [Meganyctiphanes norvegica]
MGELGQGDTQLHLRWHSHATTFTAMLSELHNGRTYTDVALVCDGGIVRAHRAVLSLCSPYLASILGTSGDVDAALVLAEVPVQDVLYLVSFIYCGQVDVPQHHIASFLNTAKQLHVLGLEGGDTMVDSPHKSDSSSVSGSESGDETNNDPTTPIVNGTNNNGENEDEEEDDEEEEEDVDMTGQIGNIGIKQEVDLKDEPENMENNAALAEVTTDGRIDLNFYLQQAIQSASMPCPLCKKEFKSQSGLRDHIRLHTGERPFECEFCQMSFARASHLKRHRRMHTGEKPFECRICGKDFSRGDKLKDHLRRHEAEDKLRTIRTQMYSNEESPADGENPVTPLPAVTATPQILTQKSNNTPDQNVGPQVKRPRGRPPKNSVYTSQHQMKAQSGGGGGQHPGQQNYMPQIMGVTSIGECILRPIN